MSKSQEGDPLMYLSLSNKLSRDQIVAYRRYTGGGTVVVDRNTVFTTLIANVSLIP